MKKETTLKMLMSFFKLVNIPFFFVLNTPYKYSLLFTEEIMQKGNKITH